jgi:transcriptional regulator with XRE-family HTH domain
MTGKQLEQYRKKARRTQLRVAHDLGVSQTYLSLLESGKRVLTEKLKKKAVRAFDLPMTEMPLDTKLADAGPVSNAQLAADLGALGYTGFAYLKRSRPKNPAVVLFSALNYDKREARLVEALPWVVLTYPDLDWKELVRAVKVNDLQNRLGFVTNVARRVAESKGSTKTAVKLYRLEMNLEPSMLAREDTLCNESMTNAEREWLSTNRSEAAVHWRLLTNLSPDQLSHYGT